MMEVVGIAFIVIGGAGLMAVGLSSLGPRFLARTSRPPAIRIREKHLLGSAGLTPTPTTATHRPSLSASPTVTDELFSELFSLRAEVAGLTSDVRRMREQLDEATRQPAAGAQHAIGGAHRTAA